MPARGFARSSPAGPIDILVFYARTHARKHTEDRAKKDFSFLFGKSAVLVPRPHQKHQLFNFELIKSNSTPTF